MSLKKRISKSNEKKSDVKTSSVVLKVPFDLFVLSFYYYFIYFLFVIVKVFWELEKSPLLW